jgi:8-oxo-dGTP diphosphatase
MEQQPQLAVRAIIQNGDGKILILKRANTQHGKDEWCLPGGKIGFGESVEQTLKREIRDETRLECVCGTFLYYQEVLPTEKLPTHFISLIFQCMVSGQILLNDESSLFAWVGPDNLADYTLAFDNEQVIRKFWLTSL